jgi:hypothetical protein
MIFGDAIAHVVDPIRHLTVATALGSRFYPDLDPMGGVSQNR